MANSELYIHTLMADLSDYDDRWRAWSARPDEKTMEAAAWNT